MLQPGNYGNNMLSFSFFYYTFPYIPYFFICFLIKSSCYFFSRPSPSLPWRLSRPSYKQTQFFHLCFQAEELLELTLLLLCPHSASKWMLAQVLVGLRVYYLAKITLQLHLLLSNFVCQYKNIYSVKTAYCRTSFSSNASVCQQQRWQPR